MRPVIDLEREYGLVFDGGGARGAYQIGAWKALEEVGIKIQAVAGTSVGALNGALVCMGNLEQAENIWKKMTFSQVMDVDDEKMEELFDGETSLGEFLKSLWKKLSDGGIDITPLKELIHEVVDEEKIRNCGKEFCLLTFSLSEFRELDLSVEDIPEGLLEDFLLASAYLLGFKNEPLHGKTYLDGGVVNNVPTNSLIKRGYKDLIQIRILGPGRVPRAVIPEDGSLYEVIPRVSLGSILEFSGKRSRQNMKIGYFDTKRMIFGLEGTIYYIEQTHEECYYVEIMKLISDLEKTEYRLKLKLPISCSDKELFIGMLEASAKLMRIQKYNIYTVDELWDLVGERFERYSERHPLKLPGFVYVMIGMRKEYKMNLKGRHFLTLKDYTPAEIEYLLDLSADLKDKKKKGIPVDTLRGKNIALIFEKNSTRTRCSFEVAAHDLGMGTTYLDPASSQIGNKESIEDTARVLGRIFDGIEYRGYGQEIVEELAANAGVPVWNGLTNEYHPTQMLADLLTIREHLGRIKGLKLVYMGDARYNVGNSLMVLCSKMGMDYVVCAPKKYFPNPELVEECKEYAKESGATISMIEDVKEATKGANVIYTDVWVSMGEPDEVWTERIKDLIGYKVTKEVMENADKDAIFLHCLPSFHDLKTRLGKEKCAKHGMTEMEVTDEVFESEQSVVFDEAENRMHTIKAVMAATLGAVE
ncbi:MAG: ornithine carbamoyltransferase [Bariatricus sp.]|nr:ornithine carbamoyltransferase [Bariatricus sp.]